MQRCNPFDADTCLSSVYIKVCFLDFYLVGRNSWLPSTTPAPCTVLASSKLDQELSVCRWSSRNTESPCMSTLLRYNQCNHNHAENRTYNQCNHNHAENRTYNQCNHNHVKNKTDSN